MAILEQLRSLDQSLLSDSLKNKVEKMLTDYPTEEGLLPDELETLQAVYDKAAGYIEKVRQQNKEAEEKSLAEEEEKRVQEEQAKKAEALKNTPFPYLELFEQTKDRLSPQLKQSKKGIDLLRNKFLKNPTESNQKAVAKASQDYCNKINDFLNKQKAIEESKKTEEETKKKKQQEELAAKQQQEKEAQEKAARELSEKQEAERKAKEEEEARGVFGDAAFKNLFGS